MKAPCRVAEPLDPHETVTSLGPDDMEAGVRQVISAPVLFTEEFSEEAPPTVTVNGVEKLVPEMVSGVRPPRGPFEGATWVMDGGVLVGDGVDVGVADGVGVRVGVGVGVGVGDGDGVGVGLGLVDGVGVGVGVGVVVGVGVGVGIGEGMSVGVGVSGGDGDGLGLVDGVGDGEGAGIGSGSGPGSMSAVIDVTEPSVDTLTDTWE